MGANSSRNEPIEIGMDRPGQQNGDDDVENGGSLNETTPAIEPARDQIRPGQQNGDADVENGGSSVATANGIPKKESVQEAVAKAVEDNTLFPPNMNSNRNIEEFGAKSKSKCRSCQIPGCLTDFQECLKNIPSRLKQAKWKKKKWKVEKKLPSTLKSLIEEHARLEHTSCSEKLLFLINIVTIAFSPLYDVVTDCLAASDHFKDGNQWYAWATLIFVAIPVFLSVTLGKGHKELREAATLEKYCIQHVVFDPCRRITIFIQTFLSFVPGLSWVPLPKEVAESNDNSHGQILLNRKMFEFFGEDATQFLLQMAIELSKPNMTISGLCLSIINPRGPMLSSLYSLSTKSTTVYLELVSTDKYELRIEPPYTTWKNKLIATPAMIFTVVPRILTLSLFFASCFPLFSNYGSEGFRFGLILFICTFILYALSFAIGTYVGIIKPFEDKERKVSKSKLILSGLSALISPCLIVDQTCGTFLWASCLSIINHFILLVGLALTLEINPSMWNSSLVNSENFDSSKELYIQLVYVLLPWLFLSIFGSLFLSEFGNSGYQNSDGRYKIKKILGLGPDPDGSFFHACKIGHAPLVESMLKLYDGSFLNQTEKLEIDEWTNGKHEYTVFHLACYNNNLKVVELLVDDPNININVKTSNGHNALTYGIWHDDDRVAKILLESGRLNIEEMEGVDIDKIVKIEEDGFQFEHRGFYGNFLVVMNSPRSFKSKTRIVDN